MRKRTLFRDARGNVTVEFALVSLFFFAGIMVALDFGIYVQQKLKLGTTVEQAAMIAYKAGSTSNTSAISTYLNSYGGSGTATTITCNGTSTCGDGKCSCVTSTGGFSIVASCGVQCTGTGTNTSAYSGNYMKIVGSRTFNSVVVPDKFLGGSTMTQSAVVRLP